ncbi:MAG: stage II sporulation protein M [Chlorobi bacterium]|nr:stage II sporulation protein M [Chlorobiota bacterium]
MREAAFIRKNREKWRRMEAKITGEEPSDAAELSRIFIHIMNDLSYARTYYPKSKVNSYLNYLAQRLYFKVYHTKPGSMRRVVEFFKTEVPLIAYRYRAFIRLAFGFFFLFTAIGVLSAAKDDTFVRLILGDEYVDMTLQNIRDGNPTAVYASGPAWATHIAITFNNFIVGLKAYAAGFFAGLGTLYILMQNAIMLGAFQYFFYEHGVFWESVRAVWIHGTMEIFAMVIEAAAGLILGAGWLFPGTWPRLKAMARAARDSAKLYLSTLPFTAAAALLEGYVTRHAPHMPHWLAWAIIAGTGALIVWYYLIYPVRVARRAGITRKFAVYEFV